MEDEPEVMVSLLLSVKDGIKIGWNTSIVPLHHWSPDHQANSHAAHWLETFIVNILPKISLISLCKPWSLIESSWLIAFEGTVVIKQRNKSPASVF